jgi:hypothetical protein
MFLAIQLPLFLMITAGTVPELFYMLIGERMGDGFAMYHQIYDNTAPLSALLYWIIDIVAGRSVIVYRATAIALIFIQGLAFNNILNRHNVFATKNYLPAFLYLLLGSITFEFGMLTPLLFGHTFAILALPYFLAFSREGIENNRLFVGGFILGLAALCYLPLALYLLVAMFMIVLFASNTFRSTLLMLCGFAFPYAVLITYYFYTGSIEEFLQMHLLRPWQFNMEFTLPPADLARLMALPLVILAISLATTLSLPQRLVFQVKFQQVMWVWLLISLLLTISRDEISASTFIVLLPPIAYFGQFLFTSNFKKWIFHLMFIVLLGGTILIRYRQPLGISEALQVSNTPVLNDEANIPVELQQKRILVLGDNIRIYKDAIPATPYLNWSLAQQHFGNLDKYEVIYSLNQNLNTEMPDYIIDEAGLMKELRYKLPVTFGRYSLANYKNTYHLKK